MGSDSGQPCPCWRCVDKRTPKKMHGFVGMIVCPTCGNKRCPKASDHRFDCTGSNEPGQAGSRYLGGPS